MPLAKAALVPGLRYGHCGGWNYTTLNRKKITSIPRQWRKITTLKSGKGQHHATGKNYDQYSWKHNSRLMVQIFSAISNHKQRRWKNYSGSRGRTRSCGELPMIQWSGRMTWTSSSGGVVVWDAEGLPSYWKSLFEIYSFFM